MDRLVLDIPDGTPLALTDGSALGNPGPCGRDAGIPPGRPDKRLFIDSTNIEVLFLSKENKDGHLKLLFTN